MFQIFAFSLNINHRTMTIFLESTINKPSPCKDEQGNCGNFELKNLFEEILTEKGELAQAEINWIDDETVSVKGVTNQSLQSFLIQAEEQGKDLTFTKQTYITIA